MTLFCSNFYTLSSHYRFKAAATGGVFRKSSQVNLWSKYFKNVFEGAHFSCRYKAYNFTKKWTSSQVFFKGFDHVIHRHIYTVSFPVLEAVLQRCSYENMFRKICSKFTGECLCMVALSKSHFSVGVLLRICCIFLNTLS